MRRKLFPGYNRGQTRFQPGSQFVKCGLRLGRNYCNRFSDTMVSRFKPEALTMRKRIPIQYFREADNE